MKKQLLFIIFIFFYPLLWRGAGGEVTAQNPLVKQWDKRFGGTDEDKLISFQQTKDGGYILGGWSVSDSSGDKTQSTWASTYDYWIVKIDWFGNKQWDKDFGGTDADWLYCVQQTADGGYILGGYSRSGISGDKSQNTWGGSGDYDYWIIKTDSLGNKQWDKDFGGTGGEDFQTLQQTFDGGYILGGYSLSGITGDKTQATWGGRDYWVIKIDSLGNKQWDKDFGGIDDDRLCSLQQTPDGGYILGGWSFSGISGDKTQPTWGNFDYWIVKTDSLGNKQWDKDFGGTNEERLYSIDRTIDGGYILGGWSYSDSSGDKTQNIWGSSDYWIIKTDSLGNKQWDKDFGGLSGEELFMISLTSDSGFLLSGPSASNISGDKTENNLGTQQTWIVKTDSLGNKQWDKTIFTPGDDEYGLAIQTKDGCFAIANFTPAGIGGYKTQPSCGDYDYWIIKFCDSTATTSITQLPDTQLPFSIYPNPANETLVISDKRTGKKEIEIYDLFGRTVFHSTFNIQHSTFTIDISKLSPGIYFIKAGNEVKKFVKE